MIAGAVMLVVVVTVQTLRGRLPDRACCPADPSHDLRMRAAFEDDCPPAAEGARGSPGS